MLEKINGFLQRGMPILTPLSLILGVVLGDIGQHLLFLVVWLFAIMTFIGSLSMKYSDAKIFIIYPKTILFVIAFLHILMPIWAYFLSVLVFNDHLLTIGFVLSVAVPTGITSIIWVTISKGNLPLALSIILIDTLLAPLIMPAIIHLVAGQGVEIDTTGVIFDLLWMIVLPSVLGIIVNEKTNGAFNQKYGPKLAPISKLCLFAVVMINSSTIAPYIKSITWELAGVIGLVFTIACSGYVLALLIGRVLRLDHQTRTAFLFTGGMRNIALGVVIATHYFPSKVAMPVVFGMLFQQILASLFNKITEKNRPEEP